MKNLKRRLKAGVKNNQTRVEDYLKQRPVIHNISLTDDFDSAKIKLEEVVKQEEREKRPYLNPLTIMYDPFLAFHDRDINSEYPNDVEWE